LNNESQTARILIIDDESNIRAMMRLALEHTGYQVKVAVDGIEGLEIFGAGTDFDLVLLDQRMPTMPGIDVLREIFARQAETRVILITAFGTMDLALEAIQAGAQDFLRKPFTAETLRTAVQSALERPVRRVSAVPVNLICREFTKSTINGFSFELADGHEDHKSGGDLVLDYDVHRGDQTTRVRVMLPGYVQELVRVHADTEVLPGGERFWQAMCEDALSSALWQEAALPPNNQLRIDDLTPSTKKWLDSVLTISLQDAGAVETHA
jgi:CheY-like chemotaxis protein